MGATAGTGFKSTRSQFAPNSRSASRSKSRLGSEVGSISRKSSLRTVWTHNDFTVFRIISNIAAARMEVFLNNILQEEKVQFLGRIVRFVTKFIKKKTFKTVARMIKTDLPKMLGYERCELFMQDTINKNMYSCAVDEEADE